MDVQPLATRTSEGWSTPPPVRIEVGPPRQVWTERLDGTNLSLLTPEEAALVWLYVGEPRRSPQRRRAGLPPAGAAGRGKDGSEVANLTV